MTRAERKLLSATIWLGGITGKSAAEICVLADGQGTPFIWRNVTVGQRCHQKVVEYTSSALPELPLHRRTLR